MTRDGRFLMCAPAHYGVEYVINPWMAGNVHRVVCYGSVMDRGLISALIRCWLKFLISAWFRCVLPMRDSYHLDTCPLEGGWVLYYPRAFRADSIIQIEQLVPPEKRIPISDNDAAAFACNPINIGDNIVLNRASPELKVSPRQP